MKQSINMLHRLFSGMITIMVMVVSPIFAQTADEVWGLNQRDMSVGARMTGMSIRGFAGLGDYSAMYGNPAGLGYVDRNMFVASLKGSAADAGFSINSLSYDGAYTTFDNSIGNLAFVYNIPVERGKLVAGLALSQTRSFARGLGPIVENTETTISTSFLPFDSEYSIDQNGDLGDLADLPFAAFNGGIFEYYRELYEDGKYPFLQAVVPGSLIEQSILVDESGRTYELNGAVAWQATRNIMIGGSVNFYVSDYDFDYNFTERDILDENTVDEYNVLLDDGTLLEGFDELEYIQRLSSDLTGVNLRFGMSGKINDNFRYGVTLESPTWSYFEESYGEQFTTWFDRGGSTTYGDQPDDVGNGFFEYSVRSPWRLGAGVRFKSRMYMVTGEAEIMDWKQLRLSSSEGRDVFRNVNQVIDNQYGIVLNYAFGAELELGFVDLRGGVSFRPSPYKDSAAISPSGGQKVGERRGISLGAGVKLTDKIRVDLGLHMEEERNIWDLYPSDDAGPRQMYSLEIDETLTTRIAVLQVIVKL